MATPPKYQLADPIDFLRSRGFEPLVPYPGNRSVKWPAACTDCGRESAPYVSWLLRHPAAGCRFCSAIRRGQNRRVPENVAVGVMRDAGVEPLEPYEGKGVPWRCRCTACGREVSPTYDNVRAGQQACAYCAGRKVDVAEVTARMIDAGLDPLVPFPGVAMPWPSICVSCGREVAPQFQSVARGGGCGYCSRNRLDDKSAVSRLRLAGMEPLEPFRGAHAKWRMRCATCGTEAVRSLSRAERNGGCVECNLKRRADGARRSQSDAAALMEAAELHPIEPYVSAHARWKCKCMRCGREVGTVESPIVV